VLRQRQDSTGVDASSDVSISLSHLAIDDADDVDSCRSLEPRKFRIRRPNPELVNSHPLADSDDDSAGLEEVEHDRHVIDSPTYNKRLRDEQEVLMEEPIDGRLPPKMTWKARRRPFLSMSSNFQEASRRLMQITSTDTVPSRSLSAHQLRKHEAEGVAADLVFEIEQRRCEDRTKDLPDPFTTAGAEAIRCQAEVNRALADDSCSSAAPEQRLKTGFHDARQQPGLSTGLEVLHAYQHANQPAITSQRLKLKLGVRKRKEVPMRSSPETDDTQTSESVNSIQLPSVVARKQEYQSESINPPLRQYCYQTPERPIRQPTAILLEPHASSQTTSSPGFSTLLQRARFPRPPGFAEKNDWPQRARRLGHSFLSDPDMRRYFRNNKAENSDSDSSDSASLESAKGGAAFSSKTRASRQIGSGSPHTPDQ